jgi:hypothetical protein
VSQTLASALTAILLVGQATTTAGAQEPRCAATEIELDPDPDGVETRKALVAAAALLPECPDRISVMDVTRAASGARARALTLDAFTVPGNDWIYVVQQSELLRRARRGAKVYIAVLAIVLWHEMAHLADADELEARRAEEQLWTTFIRRGLVDTVIGLQYLKGLRRRPDDRTFAPVP